MKTALTELIEELKPLSSQYSTSTALDRRIKSAYVNAIMKAKALLEKEKQQISDAYKAGYAADGRLDKGLEQYFNQTFLSNESN